MQSFQNMTFELLVSCKFSEISKNRLVNLFSTENFCKIRINLVSSSHWNVSVVRNFLSYPGKWGVGWWSTWILGITWKKKMKENVANKSFSREGESGLKLKFPFS